MSAAIIPRLLLDSSRLGSSRNQRYAAAASLVATGMAFIALLAQISIPLPFTPVPITGQTLAVLLLTLSFGGRLALPTVAGYLLVGAMGAPVFAGGRAGLTLGPTCGYLVGMLFSSAVVGTFVDRGWTKRVGGLLIACLTSSFLIFGCGLFVLSYFVPRDQLLMAGFFPFIPGDLIKSAIAIGCIAPLQRYLGHKC